MENIAQINGHASIHCLEPSNYHEATSPMFDNFVIPKADLSESNKLPHLSSFVGTLRLTVIWLDENNITWLYKSNFIKCARNGGERCMVKEIWLKNVKWLKNKMGENVMWPPTTMIEKVVKVTKYVRECHIIGEHGRDFCVSLSRWK